MSKYGKKLNFIDNNNYVDKITEESFSSDAYYNEIPDTIRYYSKNFWTSDGSNEVLATSKDRGNAMFKIEYENDSTLKLVANKSKFIDNVINEKGILPFPNVVVDILCVPPK